MFGQKPYIQYLGDDLNFIEKELPKINSHFLLLTALLFQNFTSPNTSCMAITSDHYNSINANQPSKTVQNNALPMSSETILDKKVLIVLLLKDSQEFHFSISISRHFCFTFHFSKRVKQIWISLFTSRSKWRRFFFSLSILEKSEANFHFTFHFSVGVKEIFISLFTSRNSNIYSRRTLVPICISISRHNTFCASLAALSAVLSISMSSLCHRRHHRNLWWV